MEVIDDVRSDIAFSLFTLIRAIRGKKDVSRERAAAIAHERGKEQCSFTMTWRFGS
jgi:hypothetical protein